nr:glycoprotein-N-acetylgalactosamine 3-beta-galactosyltransferase 1-like [Penaeus vannamei]
MAPADVLGAVQSEELTSIILSGTQELELQLSHKSRCLLAVASVMTASFMICINVSISDCKIEVVVGVVQGQFKDSPCMWGNPPVFSIGRVIDKNGLMRTFSRGSRTQRDYFRDMEWLQYHLYVKAKAVNENGESIKLLLLEENITRIQGEVNESNMLKKAIDLVKELQEAKRLFEEVTILCWVPLYPEAHNRTSRHVIATWGKRCNKLVFMSTMDDPSIDAVNVGSKEGYGYLWHKTMFSLQYIYKHFLNEFQWFLKADDDTYVIMENLRYMLRAYDTNDPIYFGLYYKNFGRYNAGGAGYVMGRESIRRFVEQALPNAAICSPTGKAEDVKLGNCLQRVGIKFGDTRDHIGQGRFWQHHPISIIKETKLVESYQHYPVPEWPNSSSDTVISFHRMTTSDLYLMEYFIYDIRVFTPAEPPSRCLPSA